MATPEGNVVIIAIDGSNQSERAFEWYCEHMHQPDHHVLLLHIADLTPTGQGEAHKSRLERAVTTGNQLLETYLDRLKARKISGSVQTKVSNKPGELIVEVAAEHKAIGVVIGTRGLGLIRRTIMGSVSDYVLHHAHCMVAVCKHE